LVISFSLFCDENQQLALSQPLSQLEPHQKSTLLDYLAVKILHYFSHFDSTDFWLWLIVLELHFFSGFKHFESIPNYFGRISAIFYIYFQFSFYHLILGLV
jgi:hypothetical protein